MDFAGRCSRCGLIVATVFSKLVCPSFYQLPKAMLKRKSSLETESKKRKKRPAKAKKGAGSEESLSEKENEDEHISAAEEDSDEVSIDNTLPDAEKDDRVTEQENDMKEDEGDMPETLTVEKKSSEKQKSTEIKNQEEDLSANGDSDAKSDITTMPVTVKDSLDAEDVPDVPSPKKIGSEPKAKDPTIKKDSAKIRKTKSKSSPRETSVDNEYSSPPSSSKSKKETKKKGKSNDTPASKDKKLVKKQGKDKSTGKTDAEPSTEEIRSVVVGMLANVDFDTTTLADIIKKLGANFNKDLMDRKREVKKVLEEEIDKMTKDDSTEVDDDDSEDDGVGDGAK